MAGKSSVAQRASALVSSSGESSSKKSGRGSEGEAAGEATADAPLDDGAERAAAEDWARRSCGRNAGERLVLVVVALLSGVSEAQMEVVGKRRPSGDTPDRGHSSRGAPAAG